MTRTPEFSVRTLDLRDEFIDVLVSLVMLALAIDGWLAYFR
jgi:hypothetical protein